jgi:hypothetical protein
MGSNEAGAGVFAYRSFNEQTHRPPATRLRMLAKPGGIYAASPDLFRGRVVCPGLAGVAPLLSRDQAISVPPSTTATVPVT